VVDICEIKGMPTLYCAFVCLKVSCTKSVSEWLFLQVVLDRISDKCKVLSLSKSTLNTVALDAAEMHEIHSSHSGLNSTRSGKVK